MFTPSRRSFVTVLVAASLVVGTLLTGGVLGQQGTDSTDTEAPDQDATFLRVAHVSSDAPPVDVSVDGEVVLSSVEFGNASDYLALTAGNHTVGVSTAEGNETVFEGNVTLEARSYSPKT